MKRFLLPAALLLGAFLPAAGQNARLYLPELGLPNSQVNRIYQDRTDYIWICTEGGLVRFDGLRFETYQHDRESANCLSSSSVIDMVEDGRGTKWIGTAAGLDILDSEYSSFTHFDLHRNPDTPVNPYIGRLLEVPAAGTLIVGTGGAGVFVIDSETRQELPEKRETVNRTLHTDYIHTLFLDASGRLWILPGDSKPVVLDAVTLEPATELAWSPELQKAGDLLRVNDMAEDPVTGDILLGSTEGLLLLKAGSGLIRKASGRRAATTVGASIIFDSQTASGEERLFLVGNEDGGLLHFDTETEEVRTALVSSIRQETGNWKATSSLRDAQGNLWLGLYQTGVLVAPKSRFGFSYMGFSTRGMPGENNTVVTDVYEDGQNLWVATDGGGLFCRPAAGGRKRQAERVFTRDNSALNNNAILTVTGDRYGTIWLGTYLGGLYYIEGGTALKSYPYADQVGTDRIRTLVYDPARDLLYVGTSGAGLTVIDAKTRKPIARQVDEDYRWISALHLDQTGRLWVGSYNGPFCYDPSLDRIIPFSGTAGSDLPPRIYDICSSADGSIWFGTEEGLFQWNETSRELRRYTTQDGLSNNVVRAILSADGGDMWVSTSSGLSRLTPRTGKITVFQSYDGLQGNEFRTGCAFKAPSGRLYFGGNGGLTSFSPLMVDSGGDRMPQVALARLTMLDQPVVYDPAKGSNNLIDKHISEATRIRIPRGVDMFSLEFSVPEYTNPQRLRFDYRLSGFESDWKTAPSLLRMATYTNVRPGRYRFEVKAYFDGSPEVYSERSVDLRVEAPWFLTGWAWAVYAAILVGIILLLLHFIRQRRRQAQEKKDAELKELRLGLFTNLTHEIRTPLNLVMAPLGAIREAEEDPVRKDTYNLMYRNCLRINRIVNQLMDLRKIDAGQMQLFFRETDIVYFIRDIMQSFGKLAESKRIDFSLTSAHPEETLWIDQGNFDKIVYNILSNAFKHTPDGGRIRVDVSAPTPNHGELQADVKEYVQVRIFNSGSRIEEAWISHVFDRCR